MTGAISARRLVLLASVAVATVACGDAEHSEQERGRAEQLVASANAAGVAPRLTAGVAASLYGSDGAVVCDVVRGGLRSGGAGIVVLGNPAHGRRKSITDDAVTYGRLVVQTYCPDVLDDYDDLVADIDPFEAGE